MSTPAAEGGPADTPVANGKKSRGGLTWIGVGWPILATFFATQLFNAANRAAPAPPAPNTAPLAWWQTEQFWLYVFAVLVGLSGLTVAIWVKVHETKKKSGIDGVVHDQKSTIALQTSRLQSAAHEQRLAVKKAEIAQLVAVHDELIPVAASLADMARWPREVRTTLYVKTVAGTAAAALQSVAVRDKVERPRAVVYLINAEAEPPEMLAVGFKGRGKTPRPFRRGTLRGDAAMDFVFEGSPGAIWPDLHHHKPEGYDGTASDYRTFVSVPITTESGAYGMVTLDAPQPDSLTEGHRAVTALIAELMAIALEVSQDEDAAGTPDLDDGGNRDDGDPGRASLEIYR